MHDCHCPLPTEDRTALERPSNSLAARVEVLNASISMLAEEVAETGIREHGCRKVNLGPIMPSRKT